MNWSFSSLMIYEACPLRFKFAKIDRLPEPPRAPDNPMERGNRIHKALELYVKGEAPSFACEAKQIDAFRDPLACLRTLYAEGSATAEQDWLFDKDWNECSRDDVWLWSKLDFNAKDEEGAVSVVGDYKSGKSQYKIIEHVQQMQLYAAITALRQSWADRIVVELWYVDEGHVNAGEYSREQALMFVGRFEQRAMKMFTDTYYRPNPNKTICRFCPYSPRGTGACPVGV